MAYMSYSLPTRWQHPRLLVGGLSGPSVASMRSKCLGVEAFMYFYNQVKSWCDSHLGSSYDHAYFSAGDMSYLMGMAFCYLISQDTRYADKAISIAMQDAVTYPGDSSDARRRHVTRMAFVYDWCFDRMSLSQRNTIIETAPYSLWRRANDFGIRTDEFFWGHSGLTHGIRTMGLAAILQDRVDEADNAATAALFDDYMDLVYDGTNDNNFMASWKYFGDSDGGSYRGSGPCCYTAHHETYYVYALPSLASATGWNMFTYLPWWKKILDWWIWHWRSDRSTHDQSDGERRSLWSIPTQVHAMHVGYNEADERLRGNAWWLYREILAVDQWRIWGPYHLYNCLWYDTTAPVYTQPIYGFRPNKTYSFGACKKYIARTGWTTSDFSMTLSGQRFTGGHTHRDAGHLDLAYKGTLLAVRHGCYDSSHFSPPTYQIPGDPSNTGHKWGYYSRSISHSTVRVHDSAEASENALQSYQQMFDAMTFFGRLVGGVKYYSNTGGMLWSKDVAAHAYDPNTVQHWLDSSYWSFETVAYDMWTSDPAYVVLDLHSFFYSAKCTRWKRHVVYIKPGHIDPAYLHPIVIVWDDLNTHVDTVKAAKTCVYQIQTLYAPTGTTQTAIVTGPTAKLFHRTLYPTSVQMRVVSGWKDEDGYEYPPTKISEWDFSRSGQVYRLEEWAPSSTSTPQFIHVLMPTDLTVQLASLMPVQLDTTDAEYRIRFTAPSGEIYRVTLKRGDTHGILSGWETVTPPPPEKPFPPTGLTVTPGDAQVELDWDDYPGGSASYRIYRQYKIAEGVYSSWEHVYSVYSSYKLDTGVANGTTYRYYLTTLIVSEESDPGPISPEVTPQAETPPPPPPPPTEDPMYDNRLLSAWQHIPSFVPAPSGDAAISEGDEAHTAWSYSGLDYQEPPVDISDGDEITCGPTCGIGTDIENNVVSDDTLETGTTIETEEPTTNVEGEEIGDT